MRCEITFFSCKNVFPYFPEAILALQNSIATFLNDGVCVSPHFTLSLHVHSILIYLAVMLSYLDLCDYDGTINISLTFDKMASAMSMELLLMQCMILCKYSTCVNDGFIHLVTRENYLTIYLLFISVR